MIPRIVHFIWIGDPQRIPHEHFISSKLLWLWGYEIKLWNEENLKSTLTLTLKDFLEAKNPAEKADYARLELVYRFGGIYLDCDMEMVRDPSPLLGESMFMVQGHRSFYLENCAFGAEAGHPLLKHVIEGIPAVRAIEALSGQEHKPTRISETTGPGAFNLLTMNYGGPYPTILGPESFLNSGIWEGNEKQFGLHKGLCTWVAALEENA